MHVDCYNDDTYVLVYFNARYNRIIKYHHALVVNKMSMVKAHLAVGVFS